MAPPSEDSKGLSQGIFISPPGPYTRQAENMRNGIVPGGGADLVIAFGTGPEPKELIVSAKIMAEASPVFKAELDSDPQAQLARSPQNQQFLIIADANMWMSLTFLCHILHGWYDKLEQKDYNGHLTLLDVAQIAEEFRMVEFMKPVISPKLLEPFVQRASERDDNSFRTDTDLVVIAYLLDQEQMFGLFTRRLIMDHCKPLSACVSDLFKTIHPYYILQLEEQRITAKQKIDDYLHVTANHHCSECPTITYDPELVVAIGQKLRRRIFMWPPAYTEDSTIREVLAAIESLDDFVRFGGQIYGLCCPNSIDFKKCSEAVHKDCKTTCDMVSKFLPGLCLTCVKQHRRVSYLCHHQGFGDTQLTKLDPIT